MLIPLLVATLAGALIGVEREMRHKAAGIGTNMLICGGACLFAILSFRVDPTSPSRIASNILTGVGFIGAGLIIKTSTNPNTDDQHSIRGLTTAAGIWMAAAAGMAYGASHYLLGALGTIIAIISPRLPRWFYQRHMRIQAKKDLAQGNTRLPRIKK